MSNKHLKLTVLVTIVLLTVSNGVPADSINRAQKWELTLQTRYLESTEVNFDGGASVDINSDLGFGIGVGYNLDNQLALRGNVSWLSASYAATRILDDGAGTRQEFGSRLDASTLSFGADYYFTKGRFSPFVNGSIGWTFVDTNIPAGRPITTCWWDPWWGYICDTFQPSISETEVSYGAAVGFRYNITDKAFLRASIGQYYIDYSRSEDDSDYFVSQFEFGFTL
jgi:opacity protein-like surface antigen